MTHSESRVKSILRTIRTLRRNSVTKIKSDLARTEYIDKSWKSVPWHEKKNEIVLFGKLVKSKTGVDLGVCAGNWVTNYPSATTWNNKNSEKRRKGRTQRTNENEALNSIEDQVINNESNEETGREEQTSVSGSIVRSDSPRSSMHVSTTQEMTENIVTATTLVNKGEPVIESQERQIYESPTLPGGSALETSVADTTTRQVSEPAPTMNNGRVTTRRRLGARDGALNELNRDGTERQYPQGNNDLPRRSSNRQNTQQ